MTDELNSRLYFQAHGLEINDLKSLEAAVREAVQRLLGVQKLSENEVALLRQGGVNPDIEAGPDPLTETTTSFAALLKDSLGTSEAAARLGVHITRIRKMLTTESTLYGFKIAGRWHIPRYQFTEMGLTPDIGQVNAVLDRALHPIAVYRWFTSLDPDLVIQGVAVSPLTWLLAGRSAEAIRRIAAEL